MVDINPQPNMNNNGNVITQLIDNVSQTVTEVPVNAAVQIMDRQIEFLIVFNNNQHNMTFWQITPYLADGHRVINNRNWMKMIDWLVICVLLLSILFAGTFLAPNAPPLIPASDTLMFVMLDDIHHDFTIKEGDKCDCLNAIPEDKLGVNINDQIINLMTYDEPNVADMFKEIPTTEDVDDSTCALYDLFLFVFTKLCSVQDDIISILPNESEDDNYSMEDIHEKTGQTLLSTHNLLSSKTEQNGAVSNEYIHSTNVDIPKETYPISTNEEFLDQNAA